MSTHSNLLGYLDIAFDPHPLPDGFCERHLPGYHPEAKGWVYFENGQTLFTRDTKNIPLDQWMMIEALGLCCREVPYKELRPCVGFDAEQIRLSYADVAAVA